MRRHRISGHFGEWLQGRLGPSGPVALITLPCPALHVTAEQLAEGEFRLCQPEPPLLPESRARKFFASLGLPCEGRYRLSANMPAGGGAGSSTAALLALARAAGHGGQDLASACIAAEGASDPLMLPAPDAILWAPREGRVLTALTPPPAFEIIGGFLGPPEWTDPEDLHFPDITDLVDAWNSADGDRAELARIASVSAARTTGLRGPAGDPVPALAERLGALGHVRAHTGPARGLIFAPGAVPEGAEAALANAGLRNVLRFQTGQKG